jgi:hypothetical protein
VVRVGPRYFETLGLRLVQGASFGGADGTPGRERAIVDEGFAARFFPGQSALGRRIRRAIGGPEPAGPWLTIVAVAQSLPSLRTEREDPRVYVPFRAATEPIRMVSLLVRGRSDLTATTTALREEVRALDPDLPLFFTQSIDSVVVQSRGGQRLLGSLFGFLALSGLVLASVGLYALTAHGVAERTREVGIRMALGARSMQVLWLFVRRAVVQLALGLIIGLAGALTVGQLLQSFLIETDAQDPMTFLLVAALLVVVSMAACVFPARRATRLDPAIALRHD